MAVLRGLAAIFITHLGGSACLLRVSEGWEAVAGFPFLIRILAICHGEKSLVGVDCLFYLVELVVRNGRQEQR